MLLRMFALALILTGLVCSSASASFSIGRHGGGGGPERFPACTRCRRRFERLICYARGNKPVIARGRVACLHGAAPPPVDGRSALRLPWPRPLPQAETGARRGTHPVVAYARCAGPSQSWSLVRTGGFFPGAKGGVAGLGVARSTIGGDVGRTGP